MRRRLTERFVQFEKHGDNRFTPVPTWLLHIPMSRLRRYRIIRTYSELWLTSDWKLRRGHPGRRRLAEKTGLSLRTVDRALADLRRLGLIGTRRRCRRTAVLTIRHRPAWLRRARARGTDPRLAQLKVATRKRTRRKLFQTATSSLVREQPLLEKTRSADPRDPVSALRIRPRIPAPRRTASVACPHYVAALASRLRDADSRTLAVLEHLRRRARLPEVAFATAGEALAYRRTRPDRPKLRNEAGYVVAALKTICASGNLPHPRVIADHYSDNG